MNELLQKYNEQIKQDLEITPMNIAEQSRRLPARRHFWTARLIEHKIKLNELKARQKDISFRVQQQIQDNAVVALDRHSISKTVDSNEAVKKIKQEIYDNEVIIEYLEAVQRNFFSTTYDIKNIIEIMKMEQL